ncbi:MAG TPA: hypothetical protein EYM25_06015 [Deltaproteobacteria bacterium]|nr:hypothetical protein [Deltaproteobacteria bacterium]
MSPLTTKEDFKVRVYGVLRHSGSISMYIPGLLLNESSILEIENRRYTVASVIKKDEQPHAINVLPIEKQ